MQCGDWTKPVAVAAAAAATTAATAAAAETVEPTRRRIGIVVTSHFESFYSFFIDGWQLAVAEAWTWTEPGAAMRSVYQ